jgi:hypothetical protein
VCLKRLGAVAGGEELGAVDGGGNGSGHGAGLGLKVLRAVAGGREYEGRRGELDGEVGGRGRGGGGGAEEGRAVAVAMAAQRAVRAVGKRKGDGGGRRG